MKLKGHNTQHSGHIGQFSSLVRGIGKVSLMTFIYNTKQNP